jgi:Astacin (Peptidase family M12A)
MGATAWEEEAYEIPSFCSLPPVPPREFPAGTDPARAEAILVNETKWVNHTVLHYYFFDRETDGEHVFLADGTRQWRPWTTDKPHQDVVRNAFDRWKAQDIGLEFVEVTSREEAEIRVGFMEGDGSWSYMGRQILDRGVNERTMNFGWDLLRSAREADTALHEIGHTLGLPHEHQNPNAGIVWDEEKVYANLGGPPNNWPRDKTFWNILRKIEPDAVQGSNWDPDSIMHYPFPAGLILEPERFRTQPLRPAGGLSPRDLAWVRAFYPATEDAPLLELTPFQSRELAIPPGQQRDFAIRPTATREYTLQTFGVSDTVMVLFEDAGGQLRYQCGDDDSGQDRNASMQVKLFQGREYVLRIRLYFSQGSGETAVMMW